MYFFFPFFVHPTDLCHFKVGYSLSSLTLGNCLVRKGFSSWKSLLQNVILNTGWLPLKQSQTSFFCMINLSTTVFPNVSQHQRNKLFSKVNGEKCFLIKYACIIAYIFHVRIVIHMTWRLLLRTKSPEFQIIALFPVT